MSVSGLRRHGGGGADELFAFLNAFDTDGMVPAGSEAAPEGLGGVELRRNFDGPIIR